MDECLTFFVTDKFHCI